MRRAFATALLGTVVFAAATAVHSQTAYPTKPIHILVPYPAGGTPDLVTRAVAERVSATLGQPFIIEARPGANGNIAAVAAKSAAPDGYTLMVAAPFLTINPLLDANSRFTSRDFEPVVALAASPNLLVVPASMPVSSVQELVAYAKARPGKLNTANHGTGTSNHMGTELFLATTGTDMTMIGYKGQVQSIPDLLNGQIDFMFLAAGQAAPHIKSGKIKALAISAENRLPSLPDVPTVAEAGVPAAVALPWYGLVAPARTPQDIVNKLNAEFNRALQQPDVIERLRTIYASTIGGSAADFQRLIEAENVRWAAVIKQRGIKAE